MAIYQTAEYVVAADGIDPVRRSVTEFVDHVRANEPATRMYVAWQRRDDPTRFLHLFIFEDEAALTAHSESAAVAAFEAAYRPYLVDGDVTFTDFDLVASNQH